MIAQYFFNYFLNFFLFIYLTILIFNFIEYLKDQF